MNRKIRRQTLSAQCPNQNIDNHWHRNHLDQEAKESQQKPNRSSRTRVGQNAPTSPAKIQIRKGGQKAISKGNGITARCRQSKVKHHSWENAMGDKRIGDRRNGDAHISAVFCLGLATAAPVHLRRVRLILCLGTPEWVFTHTHTRPWNA
jgi:hypothetical protein